MPARIRLQRHGRKKRPFYKIVIADQRSPRDGKFIDKIGTYNPTTVPAEIDIDIDKAVDWLQNGAQPTDTVRAILSFKGVLYKKHLLRGVRKGAIKEEDVDGLFAKWLEEKQKSYDNKKANKQKAAEEKARKEAEEKAAKLKAEQDAEKEAKAQAEAEAKAAEAAATETVEEKADDNAPTAEAKDTEEVKAAEEKKTEEPSADAAAETKE